MITKTRRGLSWTQALKLKAGSEAKAKESTRSLQAGQKTTYRVAFEPGYAFFALFVHGEAAESVELSLYDSLGVRIQNGTNSDNYFPVGWNQSIPETYTVVVRNISNRTQQFHYLAGNRS